MSLMKILINTGPSLHLERHPLSLVSMVTLLSTTLWMQLSNQLLIHLTAHPSNFSLSYLTIWAVSNRLIFKMSKITFQIIVSYNGLFDNVLCIISTILFLCHNSFQTPDV